MKRTFLVASLCVGASVLLLLVAIYVSLQLSDWGAFNSYPMGNRPSLSAALASKQRLAVAFHIAVLPLISFCVGTIAGVLANRPVLVALMGVLPVRLYYVALEGFRPLPISSAIVGIAISVLWAVVIFNRRASHRQCSTPA